MSYYINKMLTKNWILCCNSPKCTAYVCIDDYVRYFSSVRILWTRKFGGISHRTFLHIPRHSGLIGTNITLLMFLQGLKSKGGKMWKELTVMTPFLYLGLYLVKIWNRTGLADLLTVRFYFLRLFFRSVLLH